MLTTLSNGFSQSVEMAQAHQQRMLEWASRQAQPQPTAAQPQPQPQSVTPDNLQLQQTFSELPGIAAVETPRLPNDPAASEQQPPPLNTVTPQAPRTRSTSRKAATAAAVAPQATPSRRGRPKKKRTASAEQEYKPRGHNATPENEHCTVRYSAKKSSRRSARVVRGHLNMIS